VIGAASANATVWMDVVENQQLIDVDLAEFGANFAARDSKTLALQAEQAEVFAADRPERSSPMRGYSTRHTSSTHDAHRHQRRQSVAHF
jgi:hypothetical protein